MSPKGDDLRELQFLVGPTVAKAILQISDARERQAKIVRALVTNDRLAESGSNLAVSTTALPIESSE